MLPLCGFGLGVKKEGGKQHYIASYDPIGHQCVYLESTVAVETHSWRLLQVSPRLCCPD